MMSGVQESSRKRKASPCDNPKRMRRDGEKDGESPKANTYHKGGLVHSLHGNIYQLKLQMLFLKRALDKGYEFNLGTEVEDAEKFDDIVFKYKRKDENGKDENGKDEIRFVQAKHKQDDSKKITVKDLLNVDDGDFSLLKYFISYRTIKKKPIFSRYEIKDFILCTNINFNFPDLETALITPEKVKENDDILDIRGKDAARYKLRPKQRVLYENLREASDLHVLVKALEQHIRKNKPLQLRTDIFKRYHGPLSEEIFNILPKEKKNNKGKKVTEKYAKFRNEFLNGNDLSEEVGNFRKVLQSALGLIDNDQFQQEMSIKELAVSTDFGQVSKKPGDLSEDKLPNDKIEDAEIKEFLEKLVFAVNQPNEVKLGIIITKELGESSQFNLLNADLVSDSFQRTMLDWFKEKRREEGKEGVWLNAESGQEFRNSIEQKVSGLISVGISVVYPEKLATYGIRFDTNNLFEKLKTFLSKKAASKNIFHIIAPEETRLSAIKVYGVLEILKKQKEFVQYEKNDSYIFICLSTLLIQKIQKYVMDAFKSEESHNLLIIDCKSTASKDDNYMDDNYRLYEELCDILLNPNKKIILITKEDNTLIEQFEEDLKSKFVDKTSFGDLTKESKEKLLEKKVIKFQGKETVSLKQLYFKPVDDERQLDNQLNIDQQTLVKLIKDDEISIGNKLKDLGEVNDYYIDRRLRQVTFSKKKIEKDSEESSSESDLFVISGTDSGLKGNNNIFVFDNENKSAAECKFKELCDENGGRNIHWLESRSERLTWCRSHGSISKLLRYKIIEKVDKIDNTRPSCLIEEDNLVHEDNHKIVIISDAAGMGKSTLLTNLSMELKKNSGLWVLKINLNDYSTVLYEELKKRKEKKENFKFGNQDISEAVNFLLNDLLGSQEESKLKTDLEKELFKNSFNNHGKIALLFDGFDEISPNYKDIVIDLLQSFEKSKVTKLFVTTRPNMSDYLEQALKVFSHVLEPLSKEEQIEFLTKFWTKNLERKDLDKKKYTERLKTYAESIIEHISKSINDKEQRFIGIPLQTMMFAEVFQENQERTQSAWQGCKEFLESEHDKPNLIKDFALLDLYEHFVRRKFYNFHLEKNRRRNLTVPGETDDADEAYETNKKEHVILALHTLFSEEKEKLQELLPQAKNSEFVDLIRKIKEGKHNKGIVDQIIDNKPHFIHRTFADYFASFAIAEKMLETPADTLQCIDNVLLNTSPIFINSIIEKLKKNKEEKQEQIASKLGKPLLHFVNIKEHLNFIKSLLESGCNDWAEILDAVGKTPLHYAIEDNRFDIARKLLNYANDIYENNILMHGSFKQQEYENSKLVKFINIQDNFGKTALHYVKPKTNSDFAFELLLKGASIDSLPHTYVKELIEVMLYENSKDLFHGGILAVYANQDNKYRPIQEKLLLKEPGIFKELGTKDQCRILSYFFVHARIVVIKALLETMDLEQRKRILNMADNGYTPLDRVNDSDQISDDDRLEITKYLLEHGTKTNVSVGYCCHSENPNTDITRILQAAAQHGHLKTMKHFIAQEDHDNYSLHLRQASDYIQYNIIKYLDNITISEDGDTTLHTVCDSAAKLKIIKYLIDNHDINVTNNKGETPLFMAIYARSGLNVIEYLVMKGANVNWEDASGKTPLSCAVVNDQVDIINYLLEKGARISENAPQLMKDKVAFFENPNQYILDLDENGLLHTAIKSSDFEWVQFLVRHGANVNEVDRQGKTLLHWTKQVEIVELLLQYGAIFDKKDSNNNTPYDLLPKSCTENNKIIWLLNVLNKLFGSQDLMQELNIWLLKPESDDQINDLKDWGPYDDQINDLKDRGIYDYLQINDLKDWGPYDRGHPDGHDNPMLFILNARNAEGKHLLHIAADTSDYQAIKTLFKFNHNYLKEKEEYLRNRRIPRYQDYQSTSINVIDSRKNTPLHLAAQKGHVEIVCFLLENGAIFNSENFQGKTPEALARNNRHKNIVKLLQPTKNLFNAIEKNNILKIKNCIKERAYINAKNQCGKTLLHLAVSSDQFDVVQLLLDNGADIEAIDLDKNTPLHIAAKNDKIKNVKLLLQYEAIYNAKNSKDQRPLDLAHGQSQSYELLKQIDTLFKDIQSDDPRVSINNIKMVHKKYEIDISAIINIRDYQVNTLLHYAAELCEFNIVKLLLENGAIFNAKNKLNLTPIELTKHQNIKTLLKAIKSMFDNINNINIYRKQGKVSIKIITNVRDDEKRLLYEHHQFDISKFLVEGTVENSINSNESSSDES